MKGSIYNYYVSYKYHFTYDSLIKNITKELKNEN